MWSPKSKTSRSWWKSDPLRPSYRPLQPTSERSDLELSSFSNHGHRRSFSTSKAPDGDSSAGLLDLDKPLPTPPSRFGWNFPRWNAFYRRRLRKYRGYHFGILLCAITAGLVAVFNFIFTIWALSESGVHGNLGTLEDGSCDRTRRLTFWIHLLINALSTMLLGASNYTMQCLSSPTRSEVDKAHSQGIWLDIGVPSYRNLKRLSSFRVVLWWLLALSSIPLHLLYNSAVFSTLCTREYDAYVVSENFIEGAAFDIADIYPDKGGDPNPYQNTLRKYQSNQTAMVRLDKEVCIKKYVSSLISANGDVVAVTTTANDINSALSVWPGYVSSLVSPTNTGSRASTDWICSGHTPIRECGRFPATDTSTWNVHIAGPQDTAPIQYCLSQRVPEHCKLQFSLAIMIVVIVCNIIKAVCMGLIVRRNDSEPLVTLGDAIASFLDRPDETTRGKCIAGKDRFEGTRRARPPDQMLPMWEPKPTFWFRAASLRRWLVCNILCIGTLIFAGVLLVLGLENYQLASRKLSHLWDLGFGSVSQETLINLGAEYNLSGSGGLLATVLLANSPQLLLSFLYFSYNGIFTCMLLADEWNGYAYKRKPLRVTSPSEDQRGTYYLQLPYRWGVPLLLGSGTLHWLVSQSIFLARVNVINPEAKTIPGSISTCGYSPIAIIFVIALGSFIVLLGIACGFRRSKGDMPLVGSCSAAISAACHRPELDTNASQRPIMWGAVADHLASKAENDGIGHCCFTSFHVEPPIVGKQYAGFRL